MKHLNKLTTLVAATLAMAGSAFAGTILIVNGSSGTSEPGTTAAITDNLSNLHTLAGNTVVVSSDIPGSFAGYTQIWDIRFSNVFAMDATQRSNYVDYLASGGGMFVMGENSGFTARDDSVLALISEAGGGDLAFITPNSTQDVVSPFTGPNAVATVTYAAPGGVTSNGTGEWISVDGSGNGTGLAFAVGDLANAPAGALTVIFDVNFMQNAYDLPNSQNLTKNLIQFVGDEVDPPSGVPDGGFTLSLFGLALAGLFWKKRRA